MSAINFAMSDIYGGYAGTTEMTIPDNDDQKALVDTSKAETKTVAHKIGTAPNFKIYMAIVLVLLLVIFLGGRY